MVESKTSAGPPQLKAWIADNAIARICIVSPHFDDAAFSLTAFMELEGLPPVTVLTVFTQAAADSDPSYARAMGFADAVDEFQERRREDAVAMGMLKVASMHAGEIIDRPSPDMAARLTRMGLADTPSGPLLMLLPLGAGARLSVLERARRRLSKIPPGSTPHPDHVLIRDAMANTSNATPFRIGYYAEIPYQWANSPGSLRPLLANDAGRRFTEYAIAPDIPRKLAVVRSYKSQIAAEFGRTPTFQATTASIPERVYLPV